MKLEYAFIAIFGIAALYGFSLISYILIAEKMWSFLAVFITLNILIIIDAVYPYKD